MKASKKTRRQPDRFFFDKDQSGHWYIVPLARRSEWLEWSEIDDEGERSWDVPEYAFRVNGHIGFVSFESPKEIE